MATTRCYTRPAAPPGDFELDPAAKRAVQRLVADLLEQWQATMLAGARAAFARAFTGDPISQEPATSLVVSLPLVDPDAPAELLVDLAAVVDDLMEMHRCFDAPRRLSLGVDDYYALSAIAKMLELQAARVRAALTTAEIRPPAATLADELDGLLGGRDAPAAIGDLDRARRAVAEIAELLDRQALRRQSAQASAERGGGGPNHG